MAGPPPAAVEDCPVDTDGDASGVARVVVRDLEKRYGPARRALAGVSFELANGLTGLLGPNGAGKSTLMRCLAGICPWDSGSIVIDGVDPERDPGAARRKVGYMPERVSFPGEMRVAAYLRFIAATARLLPRQRRNAAVQTALERAGLTHVRDRIIGNLSKGYRQRVGLAQALLGDPPVVILDEPTAGLDPLNLLEIRPTLVDYAADHAVLLSTHGLAEARVLSDRLLVVGAGTIIYDGSVSGMQGDGPGRVRVRVSGGDGGDLGQKLAGSGWTVTRAPSAREATVEVADEAGTGELARQLVDAGYRLLTLEPTTDTLEEAFRDALARTPGPPAEGPSR